MPLPGNPLRRSHLRDIIEHTQKLTDCEIERAYVDKGYRGHAAQNPGRVFISGQKRGVFGPTCDDLVEAHKMGIWLELQNSTPLCLAIAAVALAC